MKFDWKTLKGIDMRFSKNLGIDLGTSNTLIYEAGRGIVIQQPTVAAVNGRTMATLEVGDAANLMLGKTSGEVQAFHPIRDGVIAQPVEMTGRFDSATEQAVRQIQNILAVVGVFVINQPGNG